RFVTDVTESEAALEAVQASIDATLIGGLRAFDWETAAEGLAARFRGRFPEPGAGSAVGDGRLAVRRYAREQSQPLDRREFLAVLRRHTSGWTAVERASWHAFEFLLEPGRERAVVKAHLELGGPDPGGARSMLEATVHARVVEAGLGQWRLDRFDVTEAVAVRNPHPPFREITDATGFHFNRSEANRELRQAIVDTRSSLVDSGLTVAHWNGDGFWDLLATESMNQAVLFLNDGKGGFTRGAAPYDDPRLIPSQALLVDLDGDGLDELVGNRVLYTEGRGSIGLFTRREGEWQFLPNALEFDNPSGAQRTDAQPLTAGDVNGDGLLDIVVAGYETDQSRDPERFNRVDAQDGADTLLFINHGGLRFTEESDTRGIAGARYTYAAHLFDFDADGDLDLFEGNDYGANDLWDNQGDGTFRALPDHPAAGDASNTMGVAVADWDNSGRWSLHLSNMYSHAGQRVVRLARALGGEMRQRLGRLASGNQLFVQTGGKWEDRAAALGVNAAGWAWASLFYDLDNDGDQELFVTNGNTSHRDRGAPDY
ncbi:MAG: VCBS repeat-containing protein, partial [Acidobacteria bacterium]|nr:VCBS repeat-containing protein [Acidobacteriota bacterium]